MISARQKALLPMIAEVKTPLLTMSTPISKYLCSSPWNADRPFVDGSYPQEPDVYGGFYEVVEVGNGGRELALRNFDGSVFTVHQDHASIVVG